MHSPWLHPPSKFGVSYHIISLNNHVVNKKMLHCPNKLYLQLDSPLSLRIDSLLRCGKKISQDKLWTYMVYLIGYWNRNKANCTCWLSQVWLSILPLSCFWCMPTLQLFSIRWTRNILQRFNFHARGAALSISSILKVISTRCLAYSHWKWAGEEFN